MVTTEEKIAGIEDLVKGFENLGESHLADRGNARLDELREQLKQEHALQA